MKENGITLSENYPYIDKLKPCSYDESTKAYQLDDFKIFSNVLNKDMRKLVCQGAVSVNFFMNDCIKQYASGVLTDNNDECGCSKDLAINHAVTIVGFG